MLLRRRLAGALGCAGVLGAAGLGAAIARAGQQQRTHVRAPRQDPRRIVSETLASALQQPASTHAAPGSDGGGGPDGAPNTPPSSYQSSGGTTGGVDNYFPSAAGQCSSRLGGNVKVNQNCLNITDPDLQGRAQANNETSISQDPFAPDHLMASDNNYIRGDGTCGAHFSLDGGRNWADSTVPNGFTRGSGFAREYWQAAGDTSVARDTRGNSYLSCQVFNRCTVASPNPDMSSAFTVFRSTGNNGASWNFPGGYTTVFFDPAGTSGVLEDKALMAIDDNVKSKFRDRHLCDLDRVRRRWIGVHLRGPFRQLRRDVQQPGAREPGQLAVHQHFSLRHAQRSL